MSLDSNWEEDQKATQKKMRTEVSEARAGGAAAHVKIDELARRRSQGRALRGDDVHPRPIAELTPARLGDHHHHRR